MTISWLEPQWPVPPAVHAISTFRLGGSSTVPYKALNLGAHVGDEAQNVAENRKRLRQAAQLPAEPCWLTQVHGTRVADLDTEQRGCAANSMQPADAAVTSRRGQVCAILTADCLPILFASDAGDRVAAAHAGWRGLAGGVIEATLTALAVPPQRLLAWLGPAIGPRHFEVGPEVRDALLTSDLGAATAFIPNSRGRFLADLAKLAYRRLEAAGIGRIYGGDQCTYADTERYFSYRRDGVTGRQATLIWLNVAEESNGNSAKDR